MPELTPESKATDASETRGGTVIPHGTGAALLRALALGDRTVTELVRRTGLSQPNVSNHLARLRERGLVTSQRQGRQVFYQVSSAGLARFVLMHGDAPPAEGVDAQAVAASFLEAVLTLREEEAGRVVDAALASGLSWKDLYLQVFVPTLVRIGELWEQNQLSVATEHLVTEITQRLIHRLSATLPAAPPVNAPSAVIGCVEGELHAIGGRMAADFLLAQGWRVWYLAGFLPMEHLLEAVHRHLPDAVVLCQTMEDAEGALTATVSRLQRWRGEQPLPLLVAGGRYFEKERRTPGLDLTGTDLDGVTAEMHRRILEIRRHSEPGRAPI